jgi:hypothetical protein
MNCIYCKTTFSSKTNLNNHQRTASYCLKLQGKSLSEEFKCKQCNKSFGQKNNLFRHEKKCKDSIEIQKLRNEIELLQKDKEIAILKTKTEIYEKLYNKECKTVEKIALQPKISNTNNNSNNNNTTNKNNIVNLATYDIDDIKNRYMSIIEKAEASDLYDGQTAVARMIVPCLSNSDGQKMIQCCDYSRSIFNYKDEFGNLNRDIKCIKLANAIEPIVSEKANSLMKEDFEKREKCRQFTYLKNKLRDENIELETLQEQIDNLPENSSQYIEFRKKLDNKEDFVNEIYDEFKRLQYEGATYIEEENFCDVKLVEGTEDIKKMKKNPSRFAKELSIHV